MILYSYTVWKIMFLSMAGMRCGRLQEPIQRLRVRCIATWRKKLATKTMKSQGAIFFKTCFIEYVFIYVYIYLDICIYIYEELYILEYTVDISI